MHKTERTLNFGVRPPKAQAHPLKKNRKTKNIIKQKKDKKNNEKKHKRKVKKQQKQ